MVMVWSESDLPPDSSYLSDSATFVLQGSLCEYMVHECAKTYVCVLYGSPRAPLLAPWLGELERTSLVTT